MRIRIVSTLAATLLCAPVANAQESKLLHSDANGVEMIYQLINTGQLVGCSEQFKDD